MQGFDRARPLWEITVVEGLEDGRAALDPEDPPRDHRRRRRACKIALVHVRPRAGDRPARRHARRARRRGAWASSGGSGTRSTTSAAATSASPMRSAGTVVGGLRSARRRPGRHGRAGRRDRGVGRPHGRAGDRAAVAAHDRAVAVGPLRHAHASPLRRGEGRGQAGRRHAQRRLRRRRPPAASAATTSAIGVDRPTQLRMTMPINIRTEETVGPRRQPVRPRPLPDPARHRRPGRAHARPSATSWPSSGPSRRWPWSSRSPACSTGCPRRCRPASSARCCKGVDFVTSNVPGAPIPIFLAGGRIEALFAFGPMTGAAANLTLLQLPRRPAHRRSTSTRPRSPSRRRFVDCYRAGLGRARRWRAG